MDTIIPAADCNYREVKRLIIKLASRYNFLKTRKIGKSCEGRDIFCLQIGDAKEYVLLAAAFHGSEHITSLLALIFAEQLCHSLENGTELCGIDLRRALCDRSILIVPMVNPDGCEISVCGESGILTRAGYIKRLCGGDFAHWNANIRGVDINHNFSAGWEKLHELERKSGIYGPAPTRYGGPRPESEPETISLTNLCRSLYIRQVAALHTQGEVIYWSYGENTPQSCRKIAEILAKISGYALDVPMGLAVGGGFKDWFISTYKRPGFTFEIGKGKNPLSADRLYEFYRDIEELLTIFAIM